MKPGCAVVLLGLLAWGCGRPNPSSTAPGPGISTQDADEPTAGRELPAAFESGRIFVDLRTADGRPLRLYTDTGGGLFVLPQTVERLGLAVTEAKIDGASGRVAALPALAASSWIPPITKVPGLAVWFAVREDRMFHEFMSQFMDRQIDGALGGSAFERSRITVHYPDAWACFEAG